MNWVILVGILGALAGFSAYVIAPDREYRQSMTREEKAAVANGQTITKTHKGFPVIFNSKAYNQGPLRIKPGDKGKPVFEPYGDWKQVDKHGDLFEKTSYLTNGEFITRIYFPDGSPDILMYSIPTPVSGDSANELRTIYFKVGYPTDTLAVQHSFYKDRKQILENWSFDAAGKRPVPEGWKFKRF